MIQIYADEVNAQVRKIPASEVLVDANPEENIIEIARSRDLVRRTKKVRHGRTAPARLTRKENNHMETPTHTAPPVALDRLVRQLRDINSALMAEMRRQYPVGSRVIFWRSASQRRESVGTVVSHTTAHGPEIRVRYDGSHHVVGLHVGYTKFHSLPNAEDDR